ncbi:tetratricopeptide repeat protein [Comamonas resistens]|uniref:Tetratricopeptide repeat protein n=1 Tax=Comamonas resistens TaxID=3046670 RepID=A0ABY8SVN0_9BURK|nr:tetratricopeptide repeat protein [Comamonas resistens]MDL5036283.1 tetratricopeptide repeat protein [Comamonas resistens]WHS66369.1 tetratricopeptide repeat protein [Comamonas resistens]
MAHPHRFQGLAVAAILAMGTAIASAQPSDPPAKPAESEQTSDLEKAMETENRQAAMSAELFYEILVGEMAAQEGALTDAQALMMEAARNSDNEKLYRRATELAVQSRSGEQALRNARAWLNAYPESRDANRAVLRLMVTMNRIADSASYLRREVELTPAERRGSTFLAITQLYGNASDKPLAADVVEQALESSLRDPQTGPMAWAAIGHMRLVAGQKPAALQALQNGEKLNPDSSAVALLGMELLESGSAEVEPLVQRYINKNPSPQLRMAFARVLIGQKRPADAKAQIKAITSESPEFPEAWAVLANLQLQDKEYDEAEQSITQFAALQPRLPDGVARKAGQAQLYLLQADLAEKRKRYDEADAYLQLIPDAPNLLSVQARRADLLARQGKIREARAIIRAVPAEGPNQQRLKQIAEIQLLRDANLPQEAYALQARLQTQFPDDIELAYDTALMAERAGKTHEMERLLRSIIERKPDFQHAYNALGYSYADRNIKLEEAQALIQKALDMTPGDPFITDSLAWVHFRRGHLDEAEKLLEQAYETRQDAEIAAHLGEVLWAQNKRDRALKVWREGLQTDDSNATLLETLKRLNVKP